MDGTPPPPGDEYAPLELGGGFHVLSLLCFVAALSARFLVPLLPDAWRVMPRPFMAGFAVPVFALFGLVAGLAGLRREASRSVARLGVALNGLALVLGLLLVAAFLWILPAEYRPF